MDPVDLARAWPAAAALETGLWCARARILAGIPDRSADLVMLRAADWSDRYGDQLTLWD